MYKRQNFQNKKAKLINNNKIKKNIFLRIKILFQLIKAKLLKYYIIEIKHSLPLIWEMWLVNLSQIKPSSQENLTEAKIFLVLF